MSPQPKEQVRQQRGRPPAHVTLARRMVKFHERLGAHASLRVEARGSEVRYLAWLGWAQNGAGHEATAWDASPTNAFGAALDKAGVEG